MAAKKKVINTMSEETKGAVVKADIKIAKIESLVREINKAHGKYNSSSGLLRLVFEYEKLNDYGKTILDNAEFNMPSTTDYPELVKLHIEKLGIVHEQSAVRLKLTSEWATYCRGKHNTIARPKEAFYFLFWALMILTVDKTDKEEKLSIICDYARILMVTDDEMKDLVEVIKIIYDKSDYDILSPQNLSGNYWELRAARIEALDKCIKSERILREFSDLFEVFVGIKGEEILSERDKTRWQYM